MSDYSINEDGSVELIGGPHMGVVYHYGRVELVTLDDESLTMKYEYEIVEGNVEDKQAFEMYIGDVLQQMIMEQLKTNQVVYTGGT